MINQYVKKPIPIRALDMKKIIDRSDSFEILEGFCGDAVFIDKNEHIRIKTLEGHSYPIRDDDFIIEGIKGEFYPCERKVFLDSYEVV